MYLQFTFANTFKLQATFVTKEPLSRNGKLQVITSCMRHNIFHIMLYNFIPLHIVYSGFKTCANH